MSQRQSHSVLEVLLNTASGFIISVLTSELVFPLFGVVATHAQNISIVAVFTVVSVVRSYIWRRVFNHIHMGSLHVSK